jgi:hypothetical protein
MEFHFDSLRIAENFHTRKVLQHELIEEVVARYLVYRLRLTRCYFSLFDGFLCITTRRLPERKIVESQLGLTRDRSPKFLRVFSEFSLKKI